MDTVFIYCYLKATQTYIIDIYSYSALTIWDQILLLIAKNNILAFFSIEQITSMW